MKLFDEINLSGLTPKERTTAQQIFIEEPDIFFEDSDIGNRTSTSIDIKLSDNKPVQLNYHSVPRLLYTELKHILKNYLLKSGLLIQHRLNLLRLSRKKEGCILVATLRLS